ncbi:MAG: PhnD/SsuA/transferrin family substrate-binding protein, partial [Deltaproteobacteria bacterium]|nr:PhnD/SsuA/transferrin family substrate-binding protein [Deltaproteobacteria bacterium]
LYPMLALVDAGLIPDKDVKIVWLGSHTKVAGAVKDGTVAAGGCYEDCRDAVWPTEPAKAAATRVLTYTREIPSEMIVVRRSMEPNAKQKLVKAVLSLNEAPGILAQISQGETTVTAVVPAVAADLNALTDTLRRVGVARAP